MNIELIRGFFMWSSLINMGLLIWWVVMFMCMHEWIYKMHTKWFKFTRETFDAIHYSGMAFFKISIFIFNVVPWIVLAIIKG